MHIELINQILNELDELKILDATKLPDMSLYMDQVTTLMNERLSAEGFGSESERVITKTMINNYVKNDLLPEPEKKRYNKEHLIILTLIYYLKSFLTMDEIKNLLTPLNAKYFENKREGFDLERIYSEILKVEENVHDRVKSDVKEKYETARYAFRSGNAEDAEFLRDFAFICELSYDVYIKKQIIKRFLDGMKPGDTENSAKDMAKDKTKTKSKKVKNTLPK